MFISGIRTVRIAAQTSPGSAGTGSGARRCAVATCDRRRAPAARPRGSFRTTSPSPARAARRSPSGRRPRRVGMSSAILATFGRPQVRHPLVVLGVVADRAGHVVLLQAPRSGGAGPAFPEPPTGVRACSSRSVRQELVARRLGPVAKFGSISGSSSTIGDPPRLGRVREEGVGEQDHRRAVRDRDPRRFDRHVEAVRGRSTRRRTGIGDSPWRPYSARSRSDCSVFVGIPVDGPARCTSTTTSGSSSITASPSVSAFRSMPGPLVPVTPRCPANDAPSAIAGGGDLVLGLEREHAEVLESRELVQQLGGRGDRIAGVEQRKPAALGWPRPGPTRARRSRRCSDTCPARAGAGLIS